MQAYGADGRYLGELRNGKLVTKSDGSARGNGFMPSADVVGHVPYVNHVGTVMIVGYDDFPGPEKFR